MKLRVESRVLRLRDRRLNGTIAAIVAAMLAAWIPPAVMAAPSEMFLSWRAPHGEPRATDALMADCRDTSRVDTLYLSFEIDKIRPGLSRMTGMVFLTPQNGDSLHSFWHFESGGSNEGGLLVEFAPFVDYPCRSPWEESGDGIVRYDHRGRGRLGFEYALVPAEAKPLRPNARYCFARVLVSHRRLHLAGCAQPLCVEWADARLGFATGRELDLRRGSGRVVTWNLPPGASCGSRQWDPLARPWKRKQGTVDLQGRD